MSYQCHQRSIIFANRCSNDDPEGLLERGHRAAARSHHVGDRGSIYFDHARGTFVVLFDKTFKYFADIFTKESPNSHFMKFSTLIFF